MFLIGSYAAELRGQPFPRPTWQSDIDLYASGADCDSLIASLKDAWPSPIQRERQLVNRLGLEMVNGKALRPKVLDLWRAPKPVLDAFAALPDNMGVIQFGRAVQVVSAATEATLKEVYQQLPNTKRPQHDADLAWLKENNLFGSPRTAAHEQLAEAIGAAISGV
jgi:hypothetical protein